MNKPTVFVGTTILAACACGTGAGLASISTAAGVAIPSGWPYATVLAIGGFLLIKGIDRQRARLLALAALATLLLAGLLAPPRVMRDSYEHSAGNLIGFVLYLAAAALLIATFIRIYRSRVDGPLLAVLGGAALAAGCTCCLTPGAIRYTLLSTGVVPSPLVSRLVLVLLAVAVALVGFSAVRNWRGAAFFLAGVTLVYPIEKLVEFLVPTWQIGEASLTFLLRYPVWLAGTGLILYGAATMLTAERSESDESLEAMAAA